MAVEDHFLRGRQQVAAAVETNPGTAETLVAADCKIQPFRSDTPFDPEYERFANDQCADDLAAAADFVGGKKGTINFGTVIQTSGVVGTAPAIGRYIRGCGAKEDTVKSITIGAPSGGDDELTEGEIYSATGSKTGIIEQTISGAGTLRYIVLTGGELADTDVVTAGGDSATCSGSSSDYATRYTPDSDDMDTLTLLRALKNDQGTSAQDYIYRLRGAMGRFTITAQPHDILRFNGAYQGVVDLAGVGSFLSGVSYESVAYQPKFINATVQGDAVALPIADFTFDCGSRVEMDPDPTTIGGAEGYDFARIADREPTLQIAPKRMKPGTFDDLGKLGSASTFAIVITIGTTPGIFELIIPKAQIREWGSGERAGRETAEMTLHATRADATDTDWKMYFR